MNRAEISRIGDRTIKEADGTEESALTKLHREAEVLLGGTLTGVATGAEEAVKDPWNTGLKLAGSVAVGAGLAYLQRGAGIGRLAGETLGLAMGVAFMTDVANPGRLDKLGSALHDTWNSAKYVDRNKAVIEQSLGRFAFDTGLMMAGGLAGTALGKGVFAPKVEPLGMSNMLGSRMSELPGAAPKSSFGKSGLVVEATDPSVPSSHSGGRTSSLDKAIKDSDIRSPLEARIEAPKAYSQPHPSMKDIPAREVLENRDVRNLGDAELLARRQVNKRGDGQITRTTNSYGEVTEFEYSYRGLNQEMIRVKYPDGTVAELINGDLWQVTPPGKPSTKWYGRIVLDNDGTLTKLPGSGGSETIFLNGLREISASDGPGMRMVQDHRGRTLKVSSSYTDTITAYEYDGGDLPIRAYESHNGHIYQVA